jgi:hypothetical protein
VEADAHAFDGEVGARRSAGGEHVERPARTLDGELCGGREVDRHVEAMRDVVGPAGRQQRDLRLRTGHVGGGVQRAVTAEQHDAALGAEERVRQLVQRGGDMRLGARAERAQQRDGVSQQCRPTHETARIRIRDHEQVGGVRCEPERPAPQRRQWGWYGGRECRGCHGAGNL